MCCGLWSLCHTIQHRAVLIIFPLNLQTITITQMLPTGVEGASKYKENCPNMSRQPGLCGLAKCLESLQPITWLWYWQTKSTTTKINQLDRTGHGAVVSRPFWIYLLWPRSWTFDLMINQFIFVLGCTNISNSVKFAKAVEKKSCSQTYGMQGWTLTFEVLTWASNQFIFLHKYIKIVDLVKFTSSVI